MAGAVVGDGGMAGAVSTAAARLAKTAWIASTIWSLSGLVTWASAPASSPLRRVSSEISDENNTVTVSGVSGTGFTSGDNTASLVPGGGGHVYKLFFTVGNVFDIDTITLTFTLDNHAVTSINIDTVGTPEPSTLALFGLGLLGTGIWVRRRRKRAA